MISRPSGLVRAALLAFLPLVLAAALTFVAAALDGESFHDVVLLPPEGVSPGRLFIALLAMLTGYAGVYFAPGLLILRTLRIALPNPVANALAAFTLSLLAVSVAWIAAYAVTSGIAGRVCLYLTVAVVDGLALAAGVWLAPGSAALPELPRATRGRARRELLLPVAAIVLVFVLGALLMPGKITTEALEGDATEVRGFAASLFNGGLPRWDLETGAWGFYPTFMFVAYPVFFSLAIGGLSEAAVRLPALLFLGVLILATLDLAVRPGSGAKASFGWALPPVLAVGYLSMQVGAYYAGYHPFHGDLGCSPLEEWMVTGLAVAAVLFVRDGAPVIGAIAALLSILTFPSGLMLVGLFGLAGLLTSAPDLRRVVFRWGVVLTSLLVGYGLLLVAYTLSNGSFEAMIAEWYAKYFQGRASFGSESPVRILKAFGWFVLLSGGLPVVGFLLAAFRGDRMSKWLAAAGGVWLMFFLFSPNKNVHYFMPIALIPIATAIRSLPAWGRGAAISSAALTVSAIVAIALCWPRSTPPYTAEREFGRRTIFLADSEEEAVAYSKVIYNLVQPLWRWKPGSPWTVGHHTWVLYADRGYELDREYDFYVGRHRPNVEGLLEVTRFPLPDGGAAILWSPGGRSTFREWKNKTYPLREDLSRFNFEMPRETGAMTLPREDKVLASALPYLAVAVGLYGFRNAWVAILLYHAGIVAFLVSRSGVARLGAIHHGRDGFWAFTSSGVALLGGVLLYVLWPHLGLAGPGLAERLAGFGLRGTAWRLFMIYFVTIHPLLEEVHWRGTLGNPRPGIVPSDVAFAGYHALVLVLLIRGPWVVVAVVALVLASWGWRLLAARMGGLSVPFLSHAAADLGIIVAADRLL